MTVCPVPKFTNVFAWFHTIVNLMEPPSIIEKHSIPPMKVFQDDFVSSPCHFDVCPGDLPRPESPQCSLSSANRDCEEDSEDRNPRFGKRLSRSGDENQAMLALSY